MLTRHAFQQRFGRRAVIGMIHLLPLPGAPLYGGSMDEVLGRALVDAHALAGGGADALAVENFGDRPFRGARVEPETVAAMTRVIAEVMRTVSLPLGVNVLRNDAGAALAVAAATGAAFIRVNVHVGAMLTDQGILTGDAAETLRRRVLLAPDVAIFADHDVKHAAPLAAIDPVQSARDLRLRGLADVLVVSGRETGVAADPARVELLRAAFADVPLSVPLVIGSGLTAENAATFAAADGAIVGTAIKRGGDVDAPVDRERVARLVGAFKSEGGG
jgi:membrane complex biogenesis BtpA family protein